MHIVSVRLLKNIYLLWLEHLNELNASFAKRKNDSKCEFICPVLYKRRKIITPRHKYENTLSISYCTRAPFVISVIHYSEHDFDIFVRDALLVLGRRKSIWNATKIYIGHNMSMSISISIVRGILLIKSLKCSTFCQSLYIFMSLCVRYALKYCIWRPQGNVMWIQISSHELQRCGMI